MMTIHYSCPDLLSLRCRCWRRPERRGSGGGSRRERRDRGRSRNRRGRRGGRWEEIVDGEQARGHVEEGYAQPAQPSHLQVGGG